MSITRRHSRWLGVLFLVPFFAYGIGTALVTSVLKEPEHLAGQRTLYVGGTLLLLLNSITVVGIGVLFFPILRERSPGIAVAYVCTRVMEALTLIVGVVSRLLPSWLPRVGAVGYGLLAMGSVLELFGLPWGTLFSGPGGLFELFLGGWLIAKGHHRRRASTGGRSPGGRSRPRCRPGPP